MLGTAVTQDGFLQPAQIMGGDLDLRIWKERLPGGDLGAQSGLEVRERTHGYA
jgi:hypothetical protein